MAGLFLGCAQAHGHCPQCCWSGIDGTYRTHRIYQGWGCAKFMVDGELTTLKKMGLKVLSCLFLGPVKGVLDGRVETPRSEVGKLEVGQGEASKGAEQCWVFDLGSECPLWGRAGYLIWDLECGLGRGACVCGNLWGTGTQGLRGIPCSAVCAAGLCCSPPSAVYIHQRRARRPLELQGAAQRARF